VPSFLGDFDPKTPPDDIRFGSLWIDQTRSKGAGLASYHGNFIPEIPYQLMRRYTRPGDVVLDPFAGSGTTIDVGATLGRTILASDIRPVRSKIVRADARTLSLDGTVDLIILHPPYANIVSYSHEPGDLSRYKVDDFLDLFADVVRNLSRFLPSGRFLALVISDIYTSGELVLLPSECARRIRAIGYRLKSDIVKNIGTTKGKGFGAHKGLWRYRAIVNNFTLFEHEHIMIFERD